jgi:hypothetical protein
VNIYIYPVLDRLTENQAGNLGPGSLHTSKNSSRLRVFSAKFGKRVRCIYWNVMIKLISLYQDIKAFYKEAWIN